MTNRSGFGQNENDRIQAANNLARTANDVRTSTAAQEYLTGITDRTGGTGNVSSETDELRTTYLPDQSLGDQAVLQELTNKQNMLNMEVGAELDRVNTEFFTDLDIRRAQAVAGETRAGQRVGGEEARANLAEQGSQTRATSRVAGQEQRAGFAEQGSQLRATERVRGQEDRGRTAEEGQQQRATGRVMGQEQRAGFAEQGAQTRGTRRVEGQEARLGQRVGGQEQRATRSLEQRIGGQEQRGTRSLEQRIGGQEERATTRVTGEEERAGIRTGGSETRATRRTEGQEVRETDLQREMFRRYKEARDYGQAQRGARSY